MRRKICVFTSTRADYGLLFWTLKRLSVCAEAELQILCSGTHLSPEFGMTIREIQSDGFSVSKTCEIILSSDTPIANAKSFGLAVMGYAEALSELKPDLLLLLGDRYETLACAVASSLCHIPIGHCHGGELTEGALDDGFRHAITKLSHLHFVSTAQSRARVIQMGEDPDSVYLVGGLGVENINRLELIPRSRLELELGFSLDPPLVLCTYHPETIGSCSVPQDYSSVLKALGRRPELRILFTLPNADQESRKLMEITQNYVRQDPSRRHCSASLGRQRFLSALASSQGLIGNTSSGILEAPALKVGTINIGDRQKGRERASSIIDCRADEESVHQALERLLSQPFQASLPETQSAYGTGNASEKIVPVLLERHLTGIDKKSFYNLSV